MIRRPKLFQLDSNGIESAEAVLFLDSIKYLWVLCNIEFPINHSFAKLEYNWRFLVEYYATFAPLGVTPHQGVFKAWLVMIMLTSIATSIPLAW